MRILVANWHSHVVGGVESYVHALIPALLKRGHEVGFVHGYRTATSHDTVGGLDGLIPYWCYEELGIQSLLNKVKQWNADVVFSQGLDSPILETALLDAYPSILYAHAYYGTCATGRKCHGFPHRISCSRQFSPTCLVLHYPRRCGGLNPLTTLRNYRVEARRNSLLNRFGAVLVASQHMYQEFEKNGVPRRRLHLVHLPATDVAPYLEAPAPRIPEGRILFMARLTDVKGCDLLMLAIPEAARRLKRPLSLVVAGTGAQESILRSLSLKLQIRAEFTGWVSGTQRADLIRQTDLLAFPSFWPEPFGLTGIEAAGLGVPAAGYAVGGIPEWLIPGVSGEVAPGDPPTVEGLSEAIVRVLGEPAHYHRLCQGAWNMSRNFDWATHLDALEAVLSSVVSRSNA